MSLTERYEALAKEFDRAGLCSREGFDAMVEEVTRYHAVRQKRGPRVAHAWVLWRLAFIGDSPSNSSTMPTHPRPRTLALHHVMKAESPSPRLPTRKH